MTTNEKEEYQVVVNVRRWEFEPGKERVHDFEGLTTIECQVPSKYNLFVNCMRNFGRCHGSINMGWRFERIEKFDDGSKRWVEYHVNIGGDVEPVPGFKMKRVR